LKEGKNEDGGSEKVHGRVKRKIVKGFKKKEKKKEKKKKKFSLLMVQRLDTSQVRKAMCREGGGLKGSGEGGGEIYKVIGACVPSHNVERDGRRVGCAKGTEHLRIWGPTCT